MTDLETAALNGSLFNPHRSPFPARSASSGTNTDDELGSDISAPLDSGRYEDVPSKSNDPQTGPKGVISDRQAHDRNTRYERTKALKDARVEQERKKMVALTLDEEDELRKDEEARLLQREKQPDRAQEDDESFKEAWRAARRGQMAAERSGGMKRGLREIGSEGFLSAVERPGWIVILIYEPGISRCNALLASVLQLSLADLPLPITLYRARATSLSFSLLPSQGRCGEEDARADPDVLPTLLAYKDGELEKTWIRVDWEVKEDGVEGLLRRDGILPRHTSGDLLHGSDDGE